MNKKRKLNSKRNAPHIALSTCRALVPLETEKIRKSELTRLNKNKATHAALTAQAETFKKEEVPAFQKWMHAHCGGLREKTNAAYGEFSALQHTFFLANELCDFYPGYTEKECADAAVYFSKNNGEIPKGFEEFFRPDPAPEPENDPFGFFGNEKNDGAEASADNREFFESLLGDFSDAFGPPSAKWTRLQDSAHQTKAAIKKLYRSITKKLHPDRIGDVTPEQKELWHAAKRAYEIGDIETLEHIEAHCELLNPHHTRFAAVSAIRNGIQFYKKANAQIRRTLREMKNQPEWGFLSWSDRQKETLVRQLTQALNADLRHLTARRIEIQNLLHQMQNPTRKQTRRNRAAAYRQDPDCFDFF
jgi:hypothetical protein